MRLLVEKSTLWPRTPFFICVTAVFAAGAPASVLAASTWHVDTCVDNISGDAVARTGSLRFAAGNAISGDTIDLSGLVCVPGSVSLQTGAITFAQDDLALKGPGKDQLVISGQYNGVTEHDRIFKHTGNGTLTISNLSVANGYLTTSTTVAKGGCIYSVSNVVLDHTNVSACQARSSAVSAWGGGVYAKGDISIQSSTIANNAVDAKMYAIGGGACTADGNLTLQSSTIDSNTVKTSSSNYAAMGAGAFANDNSSVNVQDSSVSNNTATGSIYDTGGGLYVRGNLALTATTISGNSASNAGGISHFVYEGNDPATKTAVITNSTISGNHAQSFSGGLYSNVGKFTLQNSTVTQNTAGFTVRDPNGDFGDPRNIAPGVALLSVTCNCNINATLQSSIISNNTYGPTGNETESDLSATGPKAVTFSGANNLIRTTLPVNLPIPIGVISTEACPLLGPLRNNGGPTLTHALLSHSPAIDMGNGNAIDPLTLLPFAQDQRGLPYARVSGPGVILVADIGAYEVQQHEILFNTGFEGCP